MPPAPRLLTVQATEALSLLGEQIRLARRERRMTESELAERAGIARSTLQKIERGDPGVRIGLAFEAAALAGVRLFGAEGERELAERRARVTDALTLLPRAVRAPPRPFDDDF